MYVPTTPLVRQKQVFSRIQPPATELHVVYFSSGSRTQPNWLLSWPHDVSTSFSWNHLKQSYSSSYFLPTGGSKTQSCFKRNFIGFTDILLETFHVEQLLTHSFLKVCLPANTHTHRVYKYLSGIWPYLSIVSATRAKSDWEVIWTVITRKRLFARQQLERKQLHKHWGCFRYKLSEEHNGQILSTTILQHFKILTIV